MAITCAACKCEMEAREVAALLFGKKLCMSCWENYRARVRALSFKVLKEMTE